MNATKNKPTPVVPATSAEPYADQNHGTLQSRLAG